MKASLLARVAPVMFLSATLVGGMATAGFAQTQTGPTTSGAPAMHGTTAPMQGTPQNAAGAQGAGTTAESSATNGASAQSLEQMADQRIEQLHARLSITQKEQPKWDRFANVMRSNAKNLDEAYQKRAEKIDTMNAVENMRSYAHIEHMRAADMEKLVSPFQTLYAALSPQQKQDADQLFRNRAEAAQQRHQAAASAAAQPGH